MIQRIFSAALLFIFLSGCKMADLSMTTQGPTPQSEAMARNKIQETIDRQGFRRMAHHQVYQYTVRDHWRGVLARMARLWPEVDAHLHFKQNFNTFDSRMTFLNGDRSGDEIGLQSWQLYEKKRDWTSVRELDSKNKSNNYVFALATFHYFIEMPFRLSNAELLRYYGIERLNGNTYDLVFASWHSEKPSPDFDQYILWINADTKLVDYVVYTLRDNKNPLTRGMYGSVAFQDYRNVDGFLVPFSMTVMLNDDAVNGKKSLDQYFHKMTLDSFAFAGFEEKELYPFPHLEKTIDTK